MRIALVRTFSLVVSLALLGSPPGFAREWTSVNGKFKIEAEFVAFSPNGRYLALNDTYDIRIWDLNDNNELPLLKSNEIQWTGAFTPDSKRMVSGANGIVNVWEIESQKRVGVLTAQNIGYIQTITVSPDNEHIAAYSSSAGGNLKVFRLPPP